MIRREGAEIASGTTPSAALFPDARSPATPLVPARPIAAAYAADIAHFLATSDEAVHGALAAPSGFSLTPEQLAAWARELPILRAALEGMEGWLHLEYEIPRLGRRVDAVVVTTRAVFVVEFKVGADRFLPTDLEQVWDYALDLKHFHEPSHAVPLLPVLCATEAPKSDARWRPPADDGVWPPFRSNATDLRAVLASGLRRAGRLAPPPGAPAALDPATWGDGVYRPTPTIIEAARALYARHEVHEILRHDAGAKNLAETTGLIEDVIRDCRAHGRKAIVFVTGVPGAGKTLVGLHIATRHAARDDDTHASYLSGNGPLVRVLTEALTRDELPREAARRAAAVPPRPAPRKGEVRTRVEAFIQIVHRWRDYHLDRPGTPPDDHIVIFDEAQRAWTRDQLANFMRRRKGRAFSASEPAALLEAMDRHPSWGVVVCLVGGGQEINVGEAGIGEWLAAVRADHPDWRVHVSDRLDDAEYALGDTRRHLAEMALVRAPALHLATSMRSFRAEHVSAFVKALLDGRAEDGATMLRDLAGRYPIVLTRRLRSARAWIRRQRRGSERAGIVASSSAERLKPHALDVRVKRDPVHWFLAGSRDTRSSNYLEDAGTEFEVQGLELDWTCVTWDADLRWTGTGWSHHKFRGARWQHVRDAMRQRYLVNAYRVLLTRARQGMVIVVPEGSRRDRTRKAEFYDTTYAYLRGLGIPEVGAGRLPGPRLEREPEGLA